MSADSWDECPVCKKEHQKLKEEKYGKISAEEYEELLNHFRNDDKEIDFETVREDYNGGPGFDIDGNWCFSGQASCQKCAASWEIDVKCKLNEKVIILNKEEL